MTVMQLRRAVTYNHPQSKVTNLHIVFIDLYWCCMRVWLWATLHSLYLWTYFLLHSRCPIITNTC